MKTTKKVKRFQTTMGNSWWWRRFADLVDRRQEDGTIRPFDFNAAERGRGIAKPLEERARTSKRTGARKPEMLPRPEGMTRQQHRRLFRESCKLAGVPWREPRMFKTPRRERGRNWKDLSPEESAKLEAEWSEFIQNSLQIK